MGYPHRWMDGLFQGNSQSNSWMMVMDGHGWSWMVMDGHGWSWMVMDGHGWSWMVMDGHGWSWMVMGDGPG